MSLLRQGFSLFLALFWLGASSHILLQTAGLIHTGEHKHCPADASVTNHDAADGHCVTPAPDTDVPQPDLALASTVEWLICVVPKQNVERLDLCGLAPPSQELTLNSRSLVSSRTVSSPRAPSFI